MSACAWCDHEFETPAGTEARVREVIEHFEAEHDPSWVEQ